MLIFGSFCYRILADYRGGRQVKWQFNKKYTTYAVYACGVVLFAILCVNFIVNNNTLTNVIDVLSEMFSPIF